MSSSRFKYRMIGNAFYAAYKVATTQPQKFLRGMYDHMWLLMPLVATQLLQKLQDLVDDRLMNYMGTPALTIHNVQYSLYGLAQEVGLIAATSLLIFWKRKNMENKQKSILSLHLGLTVTLTTIICAVVYKSSPEIIEHFKIPAVYNATAQSYINLGLLNLMFRALYVPINTVLIACNQRMKSVALILTLVGFKTAWAFSCSHFFWNGKVTAEFLSKPMLMFSAGSIAFSFAILFYAIFSTYKLAKGGTKFDFKHAIRVWPGEIGIGIVSALCPLLFTFQIAKANAEAGFFITYQIALHLTCLLTLPVLAGMQVAIREAAAEQSPDTPLGFKPIHKSKWWPPFFFASLLPTSLALIVAASFPVKIIGWIYGYQVPGSHAPFLPIFFASWILFQWGSVFLIALRASQKNHIATRNILISGFVVQLGTTQALLYFKQCTPVGIGLAFGASCLAFLVLNWTSVTSLYWKSKLLEKELMIKKIFDNMKTFKGKIVPYRMKHLPRIRFRSFRSKAAKKSWRGSETMTQPMLNQSVENGDPYDTLEG